MLSTMLCNCSNDVEQNEQKEEVCDCQAFVLSDAEIAVNTKKANKGDPDAARSLANYFVMIVLDEKKGFYWNEIAAKNGHTNAQSEVGRDYMTGNEPINQRNFQKARFWLSKAAQKGDPDAIEYLPLLLSKTELISLTHKARRGNSDAAYKLYKYYYWVEREHDKEESYWLKKAAEGGNKDAQYFWGREMEISDRQQAIKWLSKAAKQGHNDAKAVLEQMTSNRIINKDTPH
jgi:TPR repeat protein